ncbi:hypothetical protein AB0K09_31270, partial [Streptomyces sp. NPDC049577]|uniref:hypothetical protein n=1 Tax=Streptomyces sp. NPDC049577 TaxID=3155153 RepID=UPI003441A24F
GEEFLLAEPGDELAQGGGALGVGDAVEVECWFGGSGGEGQLLVVLLLLVSGCFWVRGYCREGERSGWEVLSWGAIA